MPERKLSPESVAFAARLALSVGSGLSVLGEIKPAAVVGFGGFASFPTVVAARLRGIPVYLHEQNSVMGKVNRMMARFADRVFVSFDSAAGALGPKAEYTGNPSRYEGIAAIGKKEARGRLKLEPGRWTLFVFGGSQGAQSINRAVYDWAAANRGRSDIQVLHLSGRANYEEAEKKYREALGENAGHPPRRALLKVFVRDYLKEMELAYWSADLVLCRAGATTITEITSLGVPSVLVPYPHATENHQEWNARQLVDKGAALMVRDNELNGARIAEVVDEMMNAPERIGSMAERSKSLYREGAARRMTEILSAHLE